MTISNEPAFKPATTIEEFIALEEEARLYRMTENAKAGHGQAMRDLVAHMAPMRPPIPDIGPIETAVELAAAQKKIVRAVAAVRLSTGEGLKFARIVSMAGEALERGDLERRIEAIEAKSVVPTPPERKRSTAAARLRAFVEREAEYISAGSRYVAEMHKRITAKGKVTPEQYESAKEHITHLGQLLKDAELTEQEASELREVGKLPTKSIEQAMDAVDLALGLEPYRTAEHALWRRMTNERQRRTKGQWHTNESPPLRGPLPPKRRSKRSRLSRAAKVTGLLAVASASGGDAVETEVLRSMAEANRRGLTNASPPVGDPDN